MKLWDWISTAQFFFKRKKMYITCPSQDSVERLHIHLIPGGTSRNSLYTEILSAHVVMPTVLNHGRFQGPPRFFLGPVVLFRAKQGGGSQDDPKKGDSLKGFFFSVKSNKNYLRILYGAS